jgi:hypothetical protein
MTKRTIMMPFRRPPEEVTKEEMLSCHTWLVDEDCPETIHEAVVMLLRREALGDDSQLMPLGVGARIGE